MTTPTSKCECPNRVLCPRGCCCARCGLAIEHTPTTDSKNSSEDWEKKLQRLSGTAAGQGSYITTANAREITLQEIQQAEARGTSQEKKLWMEGMRCTNCGGNKNPDGLSDLCGTCFEEA